MKNRPPMLCGLDRLAEYMDYIRARRVGLIINHTAVNREGKSMLDVLPALGADIQKIFAPEHGLFGKADAGEHVADGTYRGIQLVSLYGKKQAPDRADLQGLDLLIYDIQDVACRFYTYVSTMAKAIEAAAACDMPFIVLDRPCIRGGVDVSGPVLDPACRSFVGYLPVTVSYAMTPGELALMAVREGWLATQWDKVTVIPLKNWRRGVYAKYPGPFVPPSPNLPSYASILAYPGTCLLEATNVSEGRGTDSPFLTLGAPWCHGEKLAQVLNGLPDLPGVTFKPCRFTPRAMPGKAMNPKYKDQPCQGVSLAISSPKDFRAWLTGLHIIHAIHSLWPGKLTFRTRFFELLSGRKDLLPQLKGGTAPKTALAGYQESIQDFKEKRRHYLLY